MKKLYFLLALGLSLFLWHPTPVWCQTDNSSNKPSLESLIRDAEKGDADAQFRLGVRYAEGNGVQKDYYEAAKWYRKAAEQGNSDAQVNLGYCYEMGYGVEKDYQKAFQLYTASAKQGEVVAQTNLGNCYAYGRGVQQDYLTAVEWYEIAARKNHPKAFYLLGTMAESGHGLEKDKKEAVRYYHKAAELGNEPAKKALERLGNPAVAAESKEKKGVGLRMQTDQVYDAFTRSSEAFYKQDDPLRVVLLGMRSSLAKKKYSAFELRLYSMDYPYLASYCNRLPSDWVEQMVHLTFSNGETISGTCSVIDARGKSSAKSEKIGRLWIYSSVLNFQSDKKDFSGFSETGRHRYITQLLSTYDIRTISLGGFVLEGNQNLKTSGIFRQMYAKLIDSVGEEDIFEARYQNLLVKEGWRSAMERTTLNPHMYYSLDRYKGQLVYGQRSGWGVYRWANDQYYWCRWAYNAPTGVVLCIPPRGFTETGGFSNCPGSYYYVGTLSGDQKSGHGTCYDSRGNAVYDGNFSFDRPTDKYPSDGLGAYKFSCLDCGDGRTYIGETKNGKRHGWGVIIWANGDCWYGKWENDTRHGNGIYLQYYPNNFQVGRWEGNTYYMF